MRGWIAIFIAALLAGAASAKTMVYVANAEDGDVGVYAMDPKSGSLSLEAKEPAGNLVMALAYNPEAGMLYAMVRSAPYRVVSFAVDAKTGALSKRGEAPLPDNMVYISLDRTGRTLFSASYAGDKVAVSAIGANGVISAAPLQILPTGRNAHSVRVDQSNKFVFVPNLGEGQILQFRFKDGRLTPNNPAAIKSPPGFGPRHFIFSPDNRFVYVLHELTGAIGQYGFDPVSGHLTEIGFTKTVPAEAGLQPGIARAPIAAGAPPPPPDPIARIWAADLHITPDGRFLYASERTSSQIALLKVEDDRLAYVRSYPTETQPRGFRISPSGDFLVAAGEKSDQLAVYRIGKAEGDLTPVGRFPGGKGAAWVEIIDLAM
jgi:6-phosphogluconolactonase